MVVIILCHVVINLHTNNCVKEEGLSTVNSKGLDLCMCWYACLYFLVMFFLLLFEYCIIQLIIFHHKNFQDV